jgi:hypothetical protein
VDDRTINSGRTRMFCTQSSLASFRIKSSAAVAPISRIGWRFVVRAGNARLANSMSSKPMTETSSGTFRPASRRAVIAPRAEMSLKANRAVKCLPRSSRSSAATGPASVSPLGELRWKPPEPVVQ